MGAKENKAREGVFFVANGECAVGATNAADIRSLEREQEQQNKTISEMGEDIKCIRQDIGDIKVAMSSQRPTWPVTIVLTLLSTTTGVLITYIVTSAVKLAAR